MSELAELQQRIEAIAAEPELLDQQAHRDAVHEVLAALDAGRVRVAEPDGEGGWKVNAWTKQAILFYFKIAEMAVHEVGPFEYYDKIPLKRGYEAMGVRVVPPGTARFGAFIERGVVMMPGYVNIGAWVGAGTMVDTWATVGSCAQIGRGVHLSGGVGIGGVLEPPGAAPVIIEDGAFIGSRCIVVEGVHVGAEAVLGANVTLTASTPILDVTGEQEVVTKGAVPPRAVVIPGMRPKRFAAGEYGTPCALIIGRRKESTDKKTSLNDVLREFALAV
jgi:2,3,4,5-tetrahydropyridine-2-carboxylate N-succinyltransferase